MFQEIEEYMESIQHADKCCEYEIRVMCKKFSELFATLDVLSSKLSLKHGEPMEEDYEIMKRLLLYLEKLWQSVGLSFTPKVHSMPDHSITQMHILVDSVIC